MRQHEEWHGLNAGELPKLLADKLEPFGFVHDSDAYFYAEDLLAGSFRLYVKLSEDGVVSTLLMDTESEEPYVLHLVENAQGAFVGEVRAAYQAVLDRIESDKAEIEKIRGVSSDHAVNKLVTYNLCQELGRLDAPGRPMLFGTTEEFLRSFGVSSIEELPELSQSQIEEFKIEAENEANNVEVTV